MTVTTTSTTPVPWQVTILMSHPDLPGVPTYLGNSTLDGYSDGATTWSSTGYPNDVQRVSACADSPVLVVSGKPSGPTDNRYETVVAGRARLFSLVLNQNQARYTDVFSRGCDRSVRRQARAPPDLFRLGALRLPLVPRRASAQPPGRPRVGVVAQPDRVGAQPFGRR